MGGTKMTAEEELALNKPRSKKTDKKYKLRQRVAKIETSLDEQFLTGRLLARFQPPRTVWTCRWIHLGRKRVGVLSEKDEAQEGKVNCSVSFVFCQKYIPSGSKKKS